MDVFDRLWVWREPELSGQLLWYRAVATDGAPVKFRICKRIAVDVDLKDAPEEALVRELGGKTPVSWTYGTTSGEGAACRRARLLVPACSICAASSAALAPPLQFLPLRLPGGPP